MKRLLVKALAFVAALTVGTQLYAAPPANDNLADAQVLTGDSGSLTADTTEATREEVEDYLDYSGSEYTVWYKWSPSCDGLVSFDTYGSDFDTILVSYVGSTDNRVDSNDDYYEDATSRIEFIAQAGKTYLIRVGGYGSECGSLVLKWSMSIPRELTGDFGVAIADNLNSDGDEYMHTLWYKWTAQTDGPVYFDAYSYGSECETHVEISTNYIAVASSWGEIAVCAQAGQTYMIRVDVYDYEYDCAMSVLKWWRDLDEGEWKILADDGVVISTLGDLPEDLKASDFPSGTTTIADSAFRSSYGVRFVTIPATVTKIGEYAFANSDDLEWVDYEGDASDVDVSNTAFVGTPYSRELPFTLILDKGVYTNVEWNADGTIATTNYEDYCDIKGFVGICPEELVITDPVTCVRSAAFFGVGNEALATVTFPSTLKEIDSYAFYGCEALEKVVGIPADAYVSDVAFVGSLYETVRPFELVTDDDVDWDWDEERGEYTYTTNTWVRGFHGVCPEEVVIPEGIYGVRGSVFSIYSQSEYGDWHSVENLKKLTLPASIKSISSYAFMGLPELAEVVFVGNKDDVEIGYGAFVGTPYYQDQPFEFTTTYSYGYDESGNYVSNLWVTGYTGCKVPETIVIPDGVYGIDYDAFSGLDGVSAVTIPASVRVIGGYAFANCGDLATVTFLGDKDKINGLDYAFYGTPYSAALEFRLLDYYMTQGGYWKDLYDEYGNWTNDVWVAYDEPQITWYVYGYVGTCPAKLDFGQYLTNGVAEVVVSADFAGADTLTEVVVPKGACLNYNGIFRDCANLATVTIGEEEYSTNKVWLTYNFQGTPWLDTVVPFELVTELNTTTNYVDVLVNVTGDGCCTPYEEEWAIKTNVVTKKIVTGYYGNVPATLTFPDDIDEIDDYVFEYCDNITEVVVPGNVKKVGYGVFSYCGNLQSVEFHEGVETIGGYLFRGCGDGLQVILPASAVVGYYVAIEGDPSDGDFTWRGDSVEWRSGSSSYGSVFDGIDGDVDVVAPRMADAIYDKAFYDGYHFGRTCVEYYTLVHLDPNGGAIEGDADYRCFDDVVSGLPTPVLAGNVFREWWDQGDNFYRNGDVWGDNVAQVYLIADWAVEKKYAVYGLEGPVEIALGEGDDYETLRRVLADAYGSEPEPSRHGLEFLYWTVDGVELNHRSVIGENSMFGAYFDEFNPLSDNPEAAVDAAAAQTYDGYVLDYKGNNAGTIQVKVGKPNKRTGEAKVSAKVQMLGTKKKISFKADPKGSWKLTVGGATKDVTLSSADASDKIVIDISEKGIFGTFGSYDIIGARNTSKKDAAYANWAGRKYEVAFTTQGRTGSAFTGGYSGVTVSIGNKGKVKITGVMADGGKVNATAQLLISDKGEACVDALVPMYSGKKGGFGFVLWIDPDYTTTYIESVNTWISTDSKAPFTAELEAIAAAAPAPASAMTFTLETVPTVSGTVLTDYLPTAVKVAFNGGKLTVAKANKIKLDKSGAPIRTGTTDNDAGVKISYAAKTGSFKGSLTVYSVVNAKLKKYKATVNGVFVNEVGYGTAVIKDVGSFPVTIR